MKIISALGTIACLSMFAGCAAEAPSTSSTESAPTVAVADGLTVVTVTSTALVGRYHSDKVDLVLTAQVVGDEVRSTITRPDGTLLTEIAVPHVVAAQAAGIAERMETASQAAASRMAELNVSSEELAVLKAVYDDAVTQMFNATDSVGRGQLRLALPYHLSILNRVVVEKAAPYMMAPSDTTTAPAPAPAPKPYVAPAKPCDELAKDPSMSFHYDTDHAATAATSAGYAAAPSTASAEYRMLQGSDWGCCGNYSGTCWYASLACYAHDAWCAKCDHGWACGPACKPG